MLSREEELEETIKLLRHTGSQLAANCDAERARANKADEALRETLIVVGQVAIERDAEKARADKTEKAALSLGCQVNNLTATLNSLAGRVKTAEIERDAAEERLRLILAGKELEE